MFETPEQSQYNTLRDAAMSIIVSGIRDHATAIASQTGVLYEAVWADLVAELRELISPAQDGRTVPWRARLYLIDDSTGECLFDSAPATPIGMAGAKEIAGLPAVAAWVCEQATKLHGSQPVGLSKAETQRRMQSFRNKLSTNGVTEGDLLLKYTVMHQHKPLFKHMKLDPLSGIVRKYMTARVHLRRADKA